MADYRTPQNLQVGPNGLPASPARLTVNSQTPNNKIALCSL